MRWRVEMRNGNYRAGMNMAYGLAVFVCLLFVTSVVLAVTVEPPQSSGYGKSERPIAVASSGPIVAASIGN